MNTRKSSQPTTSVIRDNLRQAAKESGLTLEEIGLRMGLSKSGARQAISRFLNQEDYDPRLSTILSFAQAIQKPIVKLIS